MQTIGILADLEKKGTNIEHQDPQLLSSKFTLSRGCTPLALQLPRQLKHARKAVLLVYLAHATVRIAFAWPYLARTSCKLSCSSTRVVTVESISQSDSATVSDLCLDSGISRLACPLLPFMLTSSRLALYLISRLFYSYS